MSAGDSDSDGSKRVSDSDEAANDAGSEAQEDSDGLESDDLEEDASDLEDREVPSGPRPLLHLSLSFPWPRQPRTSSPPSTVLSPPVTDSSLVTRDGDVGDDGGDQVDYDQILRYSNIDVVDDDFHVDYDDDFDSDWLVRFNDYDDVSDLSAYGGNDNGDYGGDLGNRGSSVSDSDDSGQEVTRELEVSDGDDILLPVDFEPRFFVLVLGDPGSGKEAVVENFVYMCDHSRKMPNGMIHMLVQDLSIKMYEWHDMRLDLPFVCGGNLMPRTFVLCFTGHNPDVSRLEAWIQSVRSKWANSFMVLLKLTWGANSTENLELEAQLQMLADRPVGSAVYISDGDIRKAFQEVLDSLVR